MNISVSAEYAGEINKELYEAAFKGNVEEVKHLLSDVNMNVNVNFKDPVGYTALMHAASQGHLAVCVFLVEHGASLNMQNVAGDTALIWACVRGRKDIAKLLLDKGAEVSIVNNLGFSALDYAKSRVHADKTDPLLLPMTEAVREQCNKLRETDLEFVDMIERKLVK